MLREPLDGLDVVLDGGRGVVAPLEFVQHRLSEMGHRNLLVTHTLPAYSAGRARLTRSVRRASGFVLTPQWLSIHPRAGQNTLRDYSWGDRAGMQLPGCRALSTPGRSPSALRRAEVMRTTSGVAARLHWHDRQHRLPASSRSRAWPRMRARRRRGRAPHLDPQPPLRAPWLLFRPSSRTRRAWTLLPTLRGSGRRPSLSRMLCGRSSGNLRCEPCCRGLVRPPAVTTGRNFSNRVVEPPGIGRRVQVRRDTRGPRGHNPDEVGLGHNLVTK